MSTVIFSFDPVTWGTVSDWVMVFVTILTVIFLYKTLQSQKDVQQMQNELFRIESVRFHESIKPVLKYSVSTHSGSLVGKKETLLTLEVTNSTESLASNISKNVTENEHTKQIFIPMSLDDHRNHLAKGDNPLLFHFAVNRNGNEILLMNFKYTDIAGTRYKQRVICIYDDRFPVEIYPSLPEVIPNDDITID